MYIADEFLMLLSPKNPWRDKHKSQPPHTQEKTLQRPLISISIALFTLITSSHIFTTDGTS
jgi:hypothetical protein